MAKQPKPQSSEVSNEKSKSPLLQKGPLTYNDLLAIIEQAEREEWKELDLSWRGIVELPPEVGKLTKLESLILGNDYDRAQSTEKKNQLTSLPIEIAQLKELQILVLSNTGLEEYPIVINHLTGLRHLNLSGNQLTSISDAVVEFKNLHELLLSDNQLTAWPRYVFQLSELEQLDLSFNKLHEIPEEIGGLINLKYLALYGNQLALIHEAMKKLNKLEILYIGGNQLRKIPDFIFHVGTLEELYIHNNPITGQIAKIVSMPKLKLLAIGHLQLTKLPEWLTNLPSLRILRASENLIVELDDWIGNIRSLKELLLSKNKITAIPDSISNLTNLEELSLSGNDIKYLPSSLGKTENLTSFSLDGNPLNPVLKSAYEQGLGALKAYLRSLEQAEPLFEAKLVLVGEGGVGKTTLLKALSGKKPRKGEPTTHGVSIDVHSMLLPHPKNEKVSIQFNAWDFGGQEVYRVTHQFFFSKRSVYLLVWEPRIGVEQSQVEDWLKLIRLRVGDDAKVIIVSTHARTGQRIARIDKPVFQRDYGSMIVGFIDVDSLEPDPNYPNEKYNIPKLKELIVNAAKDLEQMGMEFGKAWKEARDELIEMGQTQPRIPYSEFSVVCEKHGLESVGTRTLSGIMHDLGYIVYYGDDERLKDDVILQPEWLTKAISFVLEDRATQERDGILPDNHLEEVWFKHNFVNEPHYEKYLYPFFLRLMEKYDVSYRLQEGDASLVAQHVPQVRPNLPWLPEEEVKEDQRRLGIVCVMDDAPPGLVPWMIVRTHDYACETENHRLHWQKGMFLRYKEHGESMLELRDREFHIYTQAIGYPEFFAKVLRQTLQKLINDNWPGLEGHYHFAVPCKTTANGNPCKGRFRIDALAIFAQKGMMQIPCQVCYEPQDIMSLLYGFEEENPREQLSHIQSELVGGFADLKARLDGLESRISNYVMAIMRAMANEAKEGPRLFTLEAVDGNWHRIIEAKYRIHLWCEAEGCQHPVTEGGKGIYEFKSTREWVRKIAPYTNFLAGMLKTIVPMVSPAVDTIFGAKTIEKLGISDHLNLMGEFTSNLPDDLKISDSGKKQEGVLSEDERSGLLALHSLLRELDPQQKKIGLRRIPTYTGDFVWVCKTHYNLMQPKIPEKIE